MRLVLSHPLLTPAYVRVWASTCCRVLLWCMRGLPAHCLCEQREVDTTLRLLLRKALLGEEPAAEVGWGGRRGLGRCGAVPASCAVLCCAMLWCAVLCCAALRCAVLCCAVLCCAVLCCAALCCAVLCCAALCCAALRCAVLCCAVLCCAVLCCAVLCCAVLRCAVLSCIAAAVLCCIKACKGCASKARPAPAALEPLLQALLAPTTASILPPGGGLATYYPWGRLQSRADGPSRAAPWLRTRGRAPHAGSSQGRLHVVQLYPHHPAPPPTRRGAYMWFNHTPPAILQLGGGGGQMVRSSSGGRQGRGRRPNQSPHTSPGAVGVGPGGLTEVRVPKASPRQCWAFGCGGWTCQVPWGWGPGA